MVLITMPAKLITRKKGMNFYLFFHYMRIFCDSFSTRKDHKEPNKIILSLCALYLRQPSQKRISLV